MRDNKDDLLLTSEVARICEVSAESVRLWAKSGRLRPTATTESGVRLFSREDAERFALERRRLSDAHVA